MKISEEQVRFSRYNVRANPEMRRAFEDCHQCSWAEGDSMKQCEFALGYAAALERMMEVNSVAKPPVPDQSRRLRPSVQGRTLRDKIKGASNG